MKISIGFTGTQAGMTTEQKVTLGHYLNIATRPTKIDVEYHHGDCIGADADFHKLLEERNITNIIIHPPIINKKRAFCKSNFILEPKDYLDRNKDIVNASEILIATPKENDEQLRSGTWSTIRYCKKQKKQAFIIFPNGIMRLASS
jgi:hypothetical protein